MLKAPIDSTFSPGQALATGWLHDAQKRLSSTI